jgi:hypothetical protein
MLSARDDNEFAFTVPTDACGGLLSREQQAVSLPFKQSARRRQVPDSPNLAGKLQYHAIG